MSSVFKKFKSGDKKITSHDAHKLYQVTVSNYTGSYAEAGYAQKRIVDGTEVDVDLAVFAYETEFDDSKFEPDIYDTSGTVSTISPHTRTTNGLFKRSLHDSLQSMYYTDTTNPANTQHNIGFDKEYRALHSSAQVLSIPQVMFGGGIEKESLIITSGSIILKDDGYGNLIDTTLGHFSMSRGDLALDLNFDPLYNQVDKKIRSAYSMNALADDDKWGLDNKVRFADDSNYANKVSAKNFIPRNATFGTYVELNGVASTDAEVRATLASQSLMRIRHHDSFDYTDDEDFSIILQVSASGTQVSEDVLGPHEWNDVISKNSVGENSTRGYPFKIEYANQDNTINAGRYRFSISDGITTLSATTAVVPYTDSDGFTTMIVIKDGNTIKFTWLVNATTIASSTIDISALKKFSNKAPIVVGASTIWRGVYEKRKKGKGDYKKKKKSQIEYYRHFKGGIADLKIYNTNLPDSVTELTNILSPTNTGFGYSNKVGNVFYHHGIITLTGTSTRYMQGTNSSTFADCDIIFDNSHQIVEHEYTCNVKEQEFGFTLNPTIMKESKGRELKEFVSGDAWSPYVTTVGLYDKHARLLAIGKLAQPIKKSTKYDTTFIVRFDS